MAQLSRLSARDMAPILLPKVMIVSSTSSTRGPHIPLSREISIALTLSRNQKLDGGSLEAENHCSIYQEWVKIMVKRKFGRIKHAVLTFDIW
jgi:hypothetical protein